MRARFEPPIGTLSDPAFVDLYIRAGITDSGDREPVDGDFVYWREKMPELVARGKENGIGDRYPYLKLIGWQATGADVPPYGPYAQPPNAGPVHGWTTAFVDVGEGTPPPAPVPFEDQVVTALGAIAVTQRAILQELQAQAADFAAFRKEVETAARLVKAPIYQGTQVGKILTLRPVKP